MAQKSKVLLVGGGSTGTMVAYALETGGLAEVTIVLRSNYAKVKESGFSIDSCDHGHDIKGWRPSHILNSVPNASDSTDLAYDYIVVSTKNIPDVSPTVAEVIKSAVDPGVSAIVLMQNGLNIEKPLQERFPENTILSGVSMIGAEEKSPGVILHNEPDICKLGVFASSQHSNERKARDQACAEKFVAAYKACGKVDCQFDENVRYTRWRKLLYNASYNTVGTILGLNVTQMRLYEHVIEDLVKPIMEEIIAIAAADGIVLEQDLVMKMITVDKLDSWFLPSMAQDAAKGNYIESENIAGEPMREAQRLGVPCPTLTTVYGLLRGIQARTKQAKGVLQLDIKKPSKYSG